MTIFDGGPSGCVMVTVTAGSPAQGAGATVYVGADVLAVAVKGTSVTAVTPATAARTTVRA